MMRAAARWVLPNAVRPTAGSAGVVGGAGGGHRCDGGGDVVELRRDHRVGAAEQVADREEHGDVGVAHERPRVPGGDRREDRLRQPDRQRAHRRRRDRGALVAAHGHHGREPPGAQLVLQQPRRAAAHRVHRRRPVAVGAQRVQARAGGARHGGGADVGEGLRFVADSDVVHARRPAGVGQARDQPGDLARLGVERAEHGDVPCGHAPTSTRSPTDWNSR